MFEQVLDVAPIAANEIHGDHLGLERFKTVDTSSWQAGRKTPSTSTCKGLPTVKLQSDKWGILQHPNQDLIQFFLFITTAFVCDAG